MVAGSVFVVVLLAPVTVQFVGTGFKAWGTFQVTALIVHFLVATSTNAVGLVITAW